MEKVVEVPVFYPSMDDMRGSFERYIESVEEQFQDIGICKIVPPKAWTPRKGGYDGVDRHIPKPIRQHATGRKGVFRTLMVEAKGMSVLEDFKPYAEREEYQPKFPDDDYALEREFWKKVTYSPPLYGADVEGSLFDDKCVGWNIGNLNTILSRVLDSHGVFIPGVTTPYLYFGMWRSTFAWHTEDLDLYSVNYLHYGRPKSWYCIQPKHRQRFENIVQGLIPDMWRVCPQFLRHKELILSPAFLKQHNIPVVRVTQNAREFIINFPGAYHAGFNQGFNCAESTNFGTARWVPIGIRAGSCSCQGDSVKIDMSLFSSHLERTTLSPERAFSFRSSEHKGPSPKRARSIVSNPGGTNKKLKKSPSKLVENTIMNLTQIATAVPPFVSSSSEFESGTHSVDSTVFTDNRLSTCELKNEVKAALPISVCTQPMDTVDCKPSRRCGTVVEPNADCLRNPSCLPFMDTSTSCSQPTLTGLGCTRSDSPFLEGPQTKLLEFPVAKSKSDVSTLGVAFNVCPATVVQLKADENRKANKKAIDVLHANDYWVECSSCHRLVHCLEAVTTEFLKANSPWSCENCGGSKTCEDEVETLPLDVASGNTPQGWSRWLKERRRRGTRLSDPKWDVCYRTPCGKILRSRHEISRFFSKHAEYSHLHGNDFAFDAKVKSDSIVILAVE
mmetsp:Transcript_31647/g.43897  ORF Transcript_31647/g.43897 Transcript_31647/m.43897 type:complete len:673 (+) Transcript_31647:311-2329(+)|eukprot:CAMPEP_0196573702 /NCGR_PEP_ID=MMETSP1081-20130531/3565_1 /TAXON_ID=36882 /ORGANISM="Pyramimonas amylifera, Strain CCMP720" /LENGTH=672 /DNA_ID=CAMNT_0041891517 /DNA_START=240 /DNA_END=2258 /DNA_ORIENTATION=-